LNPEEEGNWGDLSGQSQFRAWMSSRVCVMLTSPSEVNLRNIFKRISFYHKSVSSCSLKGKTSNAARLDTGRGGVQANI
jgi:hypothetical protein